MPMHRGETILVASLTHAILCHKFLMATEQKAYGNPPGAGGRLCKFQTKETSSMKQKDLMIGVACGLVIGVVSGAVAALLLAPRNGKEMRRKLRYERDHAVDAARLKARRIMARLRREQPEEELDEEDEAFSGA